MRRMGRRLRLLIAAVILAASGLAAMYSPVMRAISATLMAFLLPGYLVTWLLWPDRGQISGVRRLSLIVPGSIISVGGVLLLLSYSCGYQSGRATLVVCVLNAALAICAYLRHRAIPANEEDRRDPRLVSDQLGLLHAFNGWHALSLLAAAVLVGSIAYAFLRPRHTAKYTELYLLTENGHLPIPGEGMESPDTLRCVIRNREGQPMGYRLLVFAITPGGWSELHSDVFRVADGSAVQAAMDLADAPLDAREFLWLLFVPGQPEPYLSLQITRHQPEIRASTRFLRAAVRQAAFRDETIR
jgi:uncharacterized membrane protein